MRMRPKRPILRAQLAAANPPQHRGGATRFYYGGAWPTGAQLVLAPGTGVPGEVCWWTGSPGDAKCCSYPGMALPLCVTYPDVE